MKIEEAAWTNLPSALAYLCYPTVNSLAAEPYDCEAMAIYSVVDLIGNKSTTEIDGHHLTVEDVHYSVG